MKIGNRLLFAGAFALLIALPLITSAQWDKKPYTEWSEKETTKLLTNSPWAQTQTFSDTSRQSSTQSSGSASTTAIAEVVNVDFHVRFMSAKPVRQAFARGLELQQKESLREQVAQRLKGFASADFPDYIVVTVTAESDKPSNMLQQANSTLYKLTTSELKNVTYLVTNNGKRLFLQEYQPPGKDGLGARFIFTRLVDGEPFISEKSGDIVFHTDLSGGNPLNASIPNSSIPNRGVPGMANATATPFGFTVNMRFKVKDMMFNGKLEY